MSGIDRLRTCWAEYFEQLYITEPLCSQLSTTGLQIVDADSPIGKTLSSHDKLREAVARLRGEMAVDLCNTSSEPLKAGGVTLICDLNEVLTAI